MIDSRFKKAVKRDGTEVPFTPLRITNAIYRAAVAVGGRNHEMAEQLCGKVIRYLEETAEADVPQVEEIQDAIEKVLIEEGHARTSKAFILYRDEQAKRRQRKGGSAIQNDEMIPWRKIWEILNWSIDHRVATVGQLNQRIEEGSFPDLVIESEEAYQLDIIKAAEAILERKSEIRVVIVAGPSSSGKTTTTIKIAEHLKKEGFEFVPFHVDNYFFDLEMHPKDEFGDYDYETPQAIDLDLLNQHLQELLEGKSVAPPFFNFKTGKREGTEEPIRLDQDKVLLIDTLHGLYAPLTSGVPEDTKFKLYIETLLQMRGPDGNYIRWTDLRLIRRMIRDFAGRAKSHESTLHHWHYVRSAELRHIIPYVNTVDHVVNGALPYELPLWSARMSQQFAEWRDKFEGDPLKRDSALRADRVHNLLDGITPWTDESIIPDNALLREFIGGSKYKY